MTMCDRHGKIGLEGSQLKIHVSLGSRTVLRMGVPYFACMLLFMLWMQEKAAL
jgi:hypothetical protein